MKIKMRNRKKLYPVAIHPTIPTNLKEFLEEYAAQNDMPENVVIRAWVQELQDGKVDLEQLKKLSY